MKKQLSENWQLWILMGSVFLALAAGARKIALELEWSEFNANIIFIVSFIAMYIIYIVFLYAVCGNVADSAAVCDIYEVITLGT